MSAHLPAGEWRTIIEDIYSPTPSIPKLTGKVPLTDDDKETLRRLYPEQPKPDWLAALLEVPDPIPLDWFEHEDDAAPTVYTWPAAVKAEPRWVLWGRTPEGRSGCPLQPSNQAAADATEPSTWSSYEEATATAKRAKLGGGFVLGPMISDPTMSFAGVDLDSCMEPGNLDSLTPWARDIIKRVNSYCEVSQSGKGIKIYFVCPTAAVTALREKGLIDSEAFGKKFAYGSGEHPPAAEIYLANRYFAVTWQAVAGCPKVLAHLTLEDIEDVFRIARDAQPDDAGVPETENRARANDNTGDNGKAASGPRTRDTSRSGEAIRIGIKAVAKGDNFEAMDSTIAENEITAPWHKEKAGKSNKRELKRIWKKACKVKEDVQASRTEFYAGNEDDGGKTSKSNAPLGGLEGEILVGTNDLIKGRLTDLGLATRLVARHHKNIRYVHALKSWFIWSGQYWRRDDTGGITRLAAETIETMFEASNTIADETFRTTFRKFALGAQSRAKISSMIGLACDASRTVLLPEALDADPMLLGVLNGTIDLKTGVFREGLREDYITKQCGVAFDPNATCPNWEAFQLKIACGDTELIAY